MKTVRPRIRRLGRRVAIATAAAFLVGIPPLALSDPPDGSFAIAKNKKGGSKEGGSKGRYGGRGRPPTAREVYWDSAPEFLHEARRDYLQSRRTGPDALEALDRSADAGYAPAQRTAARLYLDGRDGRAPIDLTKSRRYAIALGQRLLPPESKLLSKPARIRLTPSMESRVLRELERALRDALACLVMAIVSVVSEKDLVPPNCRSHATVGDFISIKMAVMATPMCHHFGVERLSPANRSVVERCVSWSSKEGSADLTQCPYARRTFDPLRQTHGWTMEVPFLPDYFVRPFFRDQFYPKEPPAARVLRLFQFWTVHGGPFKDPQGS